MKEFVMGLVALAVGIAIFVGVIWGIMWGWQYFKVFSATQSGKASYAEAEQNRQIKVLEAQATNEAATSNALARVKVAEAEAKAEIERAKGTAESNRIIGEGLKNNENYLRYLWIDKVSSGQHSVIYVPSDNGLPILEAGKR